MSVTYVLRVEAYIIETDPHKFYTSEQVNVEFEDEHPNPKKIIAACNKALRQAQKQKDMGDEGDET